MKLTRGPWLSLISVGLPTIMVVEQNKTSPQLLS